MTFNCTILTFGENMEFTKQKELTPIEYNSSGIKVLNKVQIAPRGLCFPLHWHERLEFLLLHTGSMQLLLGEESALVHSGELVIINAGQLHGGFATEQGVSYTTIMFEPSSLLNGTQVSSTLLLPIIDNRVRFLQHSDSPNVVRTAEEIIKYAALNEPSGDLLTQAKTYELIGQLYAQCLHPASPANFNDDRFQAVLTFIHLHFHKEISSKTLSKKFGYDESYFCRKFKAITGMTLTHYVLLLRLEKAQKILCTKTISVKELASACGFRESGYFCRCFKKHFGISPLQYRNQRK